VLAILPVSIGALPKSIHVNGVERVGRLVENGGGGVGPDALEGEFGAGSESGVELLAFGGIGFLGDGFYEKCEIRDEPNIGRGHVLPSK